MVVDHYESRAETGGRQVSRAAMQYSYKPVKPEALYLTPSEVEKHAEAGGMRIDLTPFGAPEVTGRIIVHADVHKGRSFAEERAATDVNLFEAVVNILPNCVRRARKYWLPRGRKVLSTVFLQVLTSMGWKKSSADRLSTVKARHATR